MPVETIAALEDAFNNCIEALLKYCSLRQRPLDRHEVYTLYDVLFYLFYSIIYSIILYFAILLLCVIVYLLSYIAIVYSIMSYMSYIMLCFLWRSGEPDVSGRVPHPAPERGAGTGDPRRPFGPAADAASGGRAPRGEPSRLGALKLISYILYVLLLWKDIDIECIEYIVTI